MAQKKLSKETLKARAKKLYFDQNPKIETIFCDEYGRFAYAKEFLIEQNKTKDVEIYEINGKALKGVDTSKVKTLAEKNVIEAEAKEKAAKEKK